MSDSNIHLASNASLTHFFIYKKKAYPFNIVIFKLFSQYFDKLPNQSSPGIKIAEDTEEDNLNLKESAITDFIDYCQNQPVQITQDNFITIHKLANKFIVPTLIQATEKFFFNNKQQLIDEYLSSTKTQQGELPNESEEIISNDFSNYATDERLLELPIPSLQRIVTKYRLKSKEDQSEITDFLFKCLDKYGQEASVLFDNLDFGLQNAEVVRRLMSEYNDKFDFKYVNNVHVKIIYLLEKEHKDIEHQLEAKMQEMYNEYKAKMEESEKTLQKQLEQNEHFKNELMEKMDDIKLQSDKRIKELTQRLYECQEKSDRCIQKLEKENQELTKKLEEGVDEKYITRCPFISTSVPNGILSKLADRVQISISGPTNPNYPLSNLLKNDNSYFTNVLNSKDRPLCNFIVFDFGRNKKVELDSYLLRSSNSYSVDPIPRSWVIEASNDGSHWFIIDKQNDNQSLNGNNMSHLFKCGSSESRIKGEPKNRYRFIKYNQLNTWNNGYPSAIILTYFEFYGDIYNSPDQ